MNVSLNPALAKFIDEQVRAGMYASADDAVNAAVARMQTEAELSPADVDDLRRDLDEGLAEADRGGFETFTAEDVIAERRAARRAREQGG